MSFLKHFIKQTFIAFIKQNGTFIVEKRVIKNNKILLKDKIEYENEEELIQFLQNSLIENTQTYISTTIDVFNQGCVDSCSHSKYKQLKINIDNVKILCIKNLYSIFIGIYELNHFKKEMEQFQIDYIFSPLLLIDFHQKNIPNSIYTLITKTFILVLIYEQKNKPLYSNLHYFKDDDELDNVDSQEEKEENFDDIDDIEEIDDLEDLDDELENELESNIEDVITDDIENDDIDASTLQKEISNVQNEIEIIDIIQHSIKEYYEHYSSNFIEHFYLFHENEISEKLTKSIEETTFLDVDINMIDITETLNDIAIKENNV